MDILATYTANVNFNSFAAEVQYHADKLNDFNRQPTIEILGIYAAALRADMAMGDGEGISGWTDDYYDLNSAIVQAQAEHHGEY